MHRRQMLAAALAAPTLATAAAGPARAAPRRPVEIRSRDGVLLPHRDWGEGRPIVFLSAWGFSADAWQYQMIPLAQQGFRVVTYDRRGHGRTADPGRGYDIDTLADDVHAVMEALDLRDAVLVGYSMGAAEATRYLTRHGRGGRVSKVVFLAPITPALTKTAVNPEGLDPQVFEANRARMQADFPAALDAAFATFIDTGASDALKAWAKGLMLQCSLNALIACNRAFTAIDLRPELRRLTLPTLVIHGGADRSAIPALTGLRTAATVPGAEMKLYEGAPHGLVFTHTARLNADLAAFARA